MLRAAILLKVPDDPTPPSTPPPSGPPAEPPSASSGQVGPTSYIVRPDVDLRQFAEGAIENKGNPPPSRPRTGGEADGATR